jgi:gamma-glutamyl:cysteine ligase YbdK (ATP-grasp superfamily)
MGIATLLRFALANWRVLLIGSGVILVAGFLWSYQVRLANARADAAAARYQVLVDTNAANLQTINRMRADRATIDAAILREQQRRKQAETKFDELLKGVNDAPDNGCVGPAVRGLFDRLREQSASDHAD